MNHPWHRHPLLLKGEEGKLFECSGCKELGFGPMYQCFMNCDFVLHKECIKPRPTDPSIIHKFMRDCEFQFLWEPPGGPNRRFCDACGRDVRGFLYHDKHNHKLDLHPCCMNLRSTMSDPHGRMKLLLTDKAPSRCVKCERKELEEVKSKEPFRGWSYVSSCGNYSYHVYCVKKLILDNWERGYFNNVASSSNMSSSRGRSMFNSSMFSTASSSTSTIIRGKSTSIFSNASSSPSKITSEKLMSMLKDINGSSLSSTIRSDQSNRSLITPSSSATNSLSLARRTGPSTSSFTRVLVNIAKIGFSVILSVVFGNPTPLFTALAEKLLDN